MVCKLPFKVLKWSLLENNHGGGNMDKINQRIEKARKELIELGMEKGFQDPQVIRKSQALDELINRYYRAEVEVKVAS